MFQFLCNVHTLLLKDWRSEFRSLQILPPTVVLALAGIVIFHFSNINFTQTSSSWAAILWIISLLALVVILDRSLVGDTKNAVLEALFVGPVTPSQFLWAKIIFTGTLVLGLQGLVIFLLWQMMGLTISAPWRTIVLTLILADFAIISMGLLCSLIAQFSHHRGAFLAGLLWPIAVPVVLLAMMAIDDPGKSENVWLILAGFDIVLLGLGPGLLKVIAGK
jgi:ABC-type transport system involved in cytochrome c biogenesis permease component